MKNEEGFVLFSSKLDFSLLQKKLVKSGA